MFVGDRLYLAHLGDSRTYLFYKNHLWQLSIDHNVGTFSKKGWITPAEIGPGVNDSALVRSLGMCEGVEMDVYDMGLRGGEIFITCSDGLSGMVSDSKISKIVAQNANNFRVLPTLLIAAANENGGKDNVTVVVSKVCE
jgi:protein phosphatase